VSSALRYMVSHLRKEEGNSSLILVITSVRKGLKETRSLGTPQWRHMFCLETELGQANCRAFVLFPLQIVFSFPP
jgi:hypothetical protein